MAAAKVQDERTTSKKARLPPKRGQIKVRVVSSAFKKAMGATKAKGELTGEGRKVRLPPKRGQVKVRMMSFISASVSRLASKVGNLLKRKKKVASEEMQRQQQLKR
ncbi:hypothetical protein SLE2022_076570 [Rubroshorea leprosula]